MIFKGVNYTSSIDYIIFGRNSYVTPTLSIWTEIAMQYSFNARTDGHLVSFTKGITIYSGKTKIKKTKHKGPIEKPSTKHPNWNRSITHESLAGQLETQIVIHIPNPLSVLYLQNKEREIFFFKIFFKKNLFYV